MKADMENGDEPSHTAMDHSSMMGAATAAAASALQGMHREEVTSGSGGVYLDLRSPGHSSSPAAAGAAEAAPAASAAPTASAGTLTSGGAASVLAGLNNGASNGVVAAGVAGAGGHAGGRRITLVNVKRQRSSGAGGPSSAQGVAGAGSADEPRDQERIILQDCDRGTTDVVLYDHKGTDRLHNLLAESFRRQETLHERFRRPFYSGNRLSRREFFCAKSARHRRADGKLDIVCYVPNPHPGKEGRLVDLSSTLDAQRYCEGQGPVKPFFDVIRVTSERPAAVPLNRQQQLSTRPDQQQGSLDAQGPNPSKRLKEYLESLPQAAALMQGLGTTTLEGSSSMPPPQRPGSAPATMAITRRPSAGPTSGRQHPTPTSSSLPTSRPHHTAPAHSRPHPTAATQPRTNHAPPAAARPHTAGTAGTSAGAGAGASMSPPAVGPGAQSPPLDSTSQQERAAVITGLYELGAVDERRRAADERVATLKEAFKAAAMLNVQVARALLTEALDDGEAQGAQAAAAAASMQPSEAPLNTALQKQHELAVARSDAQALRQEYAQAVHDMLTAMDLPTLSPDPNQAELSLADALAALAVAEADFVQSDQEFLALDQLEQDLEQARAHKAAAKQALMQAEDSTLDQEQAALEAFNEACAAFSHLKQAASTRPVQFAAANTALDDAVLAVLALLQAEASG